MQINKILVVGAGAMGSQIGMVCALAGYQVTIQDVAAGMLSAARSQLMDRMDSSVVKGRRSRQDAEAALSRLTFTTSLDAGAADVDFVIEAAT